MATLADLSAQVDATVASEASAVAAIQALAASKTDPVALQALVDKLKASQASLDSTVAANPA